jgi:hypothetical protein
MRRQFGFICVSENAWGREGNTARFAEACGAGAVGVACRRERCCTGSKSRIEEAAYSTETTQMAKAQILSQASTAMIAQANQSQQNALSLLR